MNMVINMCPAPRLMCSGRDGGVQETCAAYERALCCEVGGAVYGGGRGWRQRRGRCKVGWSVLVEGDGERKGRCVGVWGEQGKD